MTDLGTDILLVDGDIIAATDGDCETVSDMECLIQEIQDEAMTYPGDLFYDPEYGYGLQDFIQRQNTGITRLELIERIKQRLRAHEDIETATVEVSVSSWDLNSIVVAVSFRALDQDVYLILSISTDRVTVEVVNA